MMKKELGNVGLNIGGGGEGRPQAPVHSIRYNESPQYISRGFFTEMIS